MSRVDDTDPVLPGLDTVQLEQVAVFRIVLPFLPPSKNKYDGWPPAWQSGAKKKWKRWIADEVVRQQMPLGMPKIGLACRLTFATNARRDPQNYAQAVWNWVPDALVQSGLLVDDNDGRIEIGPNWGLTMLVDSRSAVPKKKREHTVITIATPRYALL